MSQTGAILGLLQLAHGAIKELKGGAGNSRGRDYKGAVRVNSQVSGGWTPAHYVMGQPSKSPTKASVRLEGSLIGKLI